MSTFECIRTFGVIQSSSLQTSVCMDSSWARDAVNSKKLPSDAHAVPLGARCHYRLKKGRQAKDQNV